jgi:sugar phosphate isomerase/epimerase
LAALSDVAARCNTSIAVEFMLFSAAPTLGACVAAVQAANRPNLVVLADVLHLTRSGGTPADVQQYPAHLFPYVQICGANGPGPAADVAAAKAEAVNARLMPNDGDLPVAEFIAATPATTILSVESPLQGQSLPTDPDAFAAAMLASGRASAGE